MLVCQSCGAQNPDNSRFCGVCGAVLAPAAAPTQALPVPAAPVRQRPAWLLPAIAAGLVALLAISAGGVWLARRAPTRGVAAATEVAEPTHSAARATPRPTAVRPKATPASAAQAELPAQTATATFVPPAALAPTDAPTNAPTNAPAQEPAASPTAAPAALGPLGPQPPARVSASGAAADSVDSQGNTTSYEAANAVDGQLDTAWRVPGNGAGAWLLLEFPAPVRVREVQILPGYAKVDPFNGVNRFTQNRRVRRVRLEFADGSSREATLADQPQLQPVPAGDILTTSVRVVVLETTSPATSDGRDFTPIGEVVVVGQAQQSVTQS